jgi:hypothetical protein
MALIRIARPPNLNAWDRRPADFNKLAEDWFANFKDPHPSVYEARTAAEELEVVAACALAHATLPRLRVYHILRIEWTDLDALGIGGRVSNETPGRTGVVAVDFNHWEIPGDRDILIELVARLHTLSLTGQDRFRWFGTSVQRQQLERFLARGDELVIGEAKRRCRHKLDEAPYTRRPLPEQMRQELQTTPPAIPQHRIAVLAHQRYTDRGSGAGSALADWLQAERDLRERYIAGLLELSPPPDTARPQDTSTSSGGEP